jgi:hypothetical protein
VKTSRSALVSSARTWPPYAARQGACLHSNGRGPSWFDDRAVSQNANGPARISSAGPYPPARPGAAAVKRPASTSPGTVKSSLPRDAGARLGLHRPLA